MRRGRATTHQIVRAALTSRIAHRDIAHCSGKAEDFYRDTKRRLDKLFGLNPRSHPYVIFDCIRDHGGQCRIVVDIDAGYWDHVIPQSEYDCFTARAEKEPGI